MNIQDDPYINLVEIFKHKKSNTSFMLGEIVSIEPLKVKLNNLELDKDDLLVNLDVAFQLNNKVVLIFLEDTQQFILLCRVGDDK